MKLARATDEDVEAVQELARVISWVSDGAHPSEKDEFEGVDFDKEDHEHLQYFHSEIMKVTNIPSGMLRVVMGFACLHDKANNILDHNSDHLAMHPSLISTLDDKGAARAIKCHDGLIKALTAIANDDSEHSLTLIKTVAKNALAGVERTA